MYFISPTIHGKIHESEIIRDDTEVLVPADTQVVVGIDSFEGSPPTDFLGSIPLYKVAAVVSQTESKAAALKVLGALGDTQLIDQYVNAYTNEELGEAENEMLRRFTTSPTVEFKADYVPADDALCVLDVLERLLDSDAKFYPQHPAFKYRRTTTPVRIKDGYPKFQYDGRGGDFSNLTWSSDRLNLSVLFRSTGHIELGGEAEAVGLPPFYPCAKFNNYMIVQDGNLWTYQLPISTNDEDLKDWLLANGLVQPYIRDFVWVVDLKGLPVLNQDRAKAATQYQAKVATQYQAQALTALAKLELESQAKLKVLKYYIQDKPEDSLLTPDQVNFLEGKGVKHGVYSPPSEAQEKTDQVNVHTFQIKLAGFSSLPKVEDVEAKVQKALAGESLKFTASQELLAEPVKDYLTTWSTLPNVQEYLLQLKQQEDAKLRRVRRQLAEAKFAILLGGYWPFPSRQDKVFTLDGLKATFETGTKTIKV